MHSSHRAGEGAVHTKEARSLEEHGWGPYELSVARRASNGPSGRRKSRQ